MLRQTVRAGRVALGVSLVAIGVVLALPGAPGPGIPIVFGGLSVLSTEFHWARRLRDEMRRGFSRLKAGSHAGGEGPARAQAPPEGEGGRGPPPPRARC